MRRFGRGRDQGSGSSASREGLLLWAEEGQDRLLSQTMAHLSDGEAVAKMGHPLLEGWERLGLAEEGAGGVEGDRGEEDEEGREDDREQEGVAVGGGARVGGGVEGGFEVLGLEGGGVRG